MRFVIATLPDVKFNLGRDLTLVKACALYGDEAILFSPTYAGTEPLLGFSRRPLLHQLWYLALLKRDPGFVVGKRLTDTQRTERIQRAIAASNDLFAKAKRVLALTQEEVAHESASAAELEEIARQIEPLVRSVETVWSDTEDFIKRAQELGRAQKLGLVTIANIHEVPSIYFDREKLRSEVAEALSNPLSYGALDERLLGDFENLSAARVQKLRAAHIGADLLSRLPGFPAASFDEIRDIRTELAPYLAQFRKAIAEMSDKVRSAPWDSDFPHEVERETRSRVFPAVAQIDEQVRSSSYLQEVAFRAVKDPLVVPASSAFGLVLSSAIHIPALAAQIASGIAGAGLIAAEAHRSWKAGRRKLQENEFFFYYRCSKLLGRMDMKAPPSSHALRRSARAHRR